MNASAKIAMVLAVLLFLNAAAFACNIAISGLDVTAKGENSSVFSEGISAPQNSDVSIKIAFNVDSFSGNDCPQDISAQAVITRYNTATHNWDSYLTTIQKSQTLSNGQVTLTWSNAFNTGLNDNYSQFRVTGNVLQNSTVLGTQQATVDVSNNSCSGVNLVANDISIDEGTTSSRTFTIENNTDYSFYISNLAMSFTTTLIRSGNLDYDNYVPAHSSSPITASLDAGFVSNDQATTGRLELTGTISGISCSSTDIGIQTFQVLVRDTGANENNYYYNGYYYNGDYYNDGFNYGNNNYYNNNYNQYGNNPQCADLDLQQNNFSIDAGTAQKVVFNLKNNSPMRFEIQQVQTTSNGVQLANFDNDKYVQSGQVGTIILTANAPNVTQDTQYSNSLKIRGVFSNGASCSLNDINRQFTSTVIANNSTQNVNCPGFSLSAPSNVALNNYGQVAFTINNQTNRSTDVYVEGSVDATPTIISLPTGVSISRSLNVAIGQKTGYLTFRSVVAGCTIPLTTVNITNTSSGETTASTTTTTTTGTTGLFAFGIAESAGVVILIVIIVVLLVGIIMGYGKGRKEADEEQPWVK